MAGADALEAKLTEACEHQASEPMPVTDPEYADPGPEPAVIRPHMTCRTWPAFSNRPRSSLTSFAMVAGSRELSIRQVTGYSSRDVWSRDRRPRS